MIIVATTAAHAYTHKAISAALPMVKRLAYPVLLSRRSLPWATYIFTDLDRLSAWQLEVAAHLYRTLKDAGCRVLNDPAKALHRLALLRRLHALGVNSFNAWPAAEVDAVDAFPVFLRTAAAHRGNLTDLLETPEALRSAVFDAVKAGYPISNLMIIEYRAQPIHDDVFRKLALFRLGDAVAPDPSVHQRHWAAKYGENGVAGEQGYRDDLALVRDMPYAAAVLKAFAAADIEYGRADYGLVGAKPEIYEINTNPMLDAIGKPHPFPERTEATQVARALYLDGMAALDSGEAKGRIAIPPTGPRKMAPRGRGRSPAYLWLP